jgi:hypothetical protein
VTTGNPEKYVVIHAPNHPNANTQGKVREHVLIASRVLGKAVPKGVIVHHVDSNPKNNANSNLVICHERDHARIHARTAAYDATGDANKMKCPYCKQYDDPANMYVRPKQYQAWHRKCSNKYKRVENPKTGPYKYGKD